MTDNRFFWKVQAPLLMNLVKAADPLSRKLGKCKMQFTISDPRGPRFMESYWAMHFRLKTLGVEFVWVDSTEG